ncbi:MAG: RQC domain-containing protein, partial [Trueperaceae bacterium]
FVIHRDMPKSVEGYYQETGRAGRDGEPADAFMTYGLQDVVQVRRMLASSDAPAAHHRVMQGRLEALLGFCETSGCRRQVLLRYFGETLEAPCGNCDTCLTPVATFDGTVVAQKLLSTVVRTGQRFGAGHLTDVLLGKHTPRVASFGHDRLSVFGIGSELSEKAWRSVARQLVAGGQLTSDPDGHGSLRVGPEAAPVLKGERAVQLREDRAPAATTAAPRRRRSVEELPSEVRARFESLRQLRSELAKAQGVPPYVVFHDATLREMAERVPVDDDGLSRISGVGEGKRSKYGPRFLEALRAMATADPDARDAGASPASIATVTSSEPASAPNGDTVDRTRALILAGYAPEAVASERGLKVRTVEHHLAELVRRGELTVQEATGLDQDAIRTVEAAHEALPDEVRGRLRPLHEVLNGRFAYGTLRAVLAGRDG